MTNLNNAPLSDGTGRQQPAVFQMAPLRRRPSRRGSQPVSNVVVPIPEDGYPEINHALSVEVGCCWCAPLCRILFALMLFRV